MKTKHAYLALSLAALTPVMAQKPGVDKAAANYKEGNFSDYLNIIKTAIDKNKEDLPEGLTADDILNSAGLGNIKAYAQSSTPKGTEWINNIYLNNGGDHQGLFKLLLSSKHKGLSVANMAPAGTDLALQFSINLESAESLIKGFMDKAAPDDAKAEFKEQMQSPVPMMGMNTSELLKKIDLRFNLAVDLDKVEKLNTPFGAFDKPNLVIRLDGVAWAWAKIGAQAIGGSGLPFQKAEANGVITYSLPAEMAQNFMGYLPTVKVDNKKDQIWIASTPAFLKKSTSGKNTLAQSAAYKATMAGLPANGSSMSYVSKDFATFAHTILSDLKAKGALDGADENASKQVDKTLDQLSKVKTGMAQVMSADANGVLISERGVQNIEQQIKDAVEAFQQQLAK